MSFPLKQRTLIRGCQAHINAGLDCAADYVALIGTPYYASFDGELSIPYPPGGQGGNWLRLRRANGDMIEAAHLSKYVRKSGLVKEGELIAYTGNTGTITTGQHLHLQVLRGAVRLDPEKYNWGSVVPQPPNQGDPMDLKQYIKDLPKETYKQAYKTPSNPDVYVTFRVDSFDTLKQLGLDNPDIHIVGKPLPSQLQADLDSTAPSQYVPVDQLYRKV